MAKTKRPQFRVNDRVTLASYTPLIPAYGGKPFVGRNTVLRVSSVVGKGTLRDPWAVNVTDDEGHFWHMQPDDIVLAEDGTSHATKRKSPAQLDREIAETLAKDRGDQRRAHAKMAAAKIPSFKISSKIPSTMTASEINKELDKLDAQDSELGRLMIEAGRGYERPSEYLKMTDPLAVELRKNFDRRQELGIEIGFRYGPNPPSRLPTGRGFGPRSKTRSPTSGGIGFGKRYGGD